MMDGLKRLNTFAKTHYGKKNLVSSFHSILGVVIYVIYLV